MTPLTQDEINKDITEKVLGKKWEEHLFVEHELIENGRQIRDNKCSCGKTFLFKEAILEHINKRPTPDFSQWDHYGPMLEKFALRPDFDIFVKDHLAVRDGAYYNFEQRIRIILNPPPRQRGGG